MKIIHETEPRVNSNKSRIILLPLQFFYDSKNLIWKGKNHDWMLSYSVHDDNKIYAKQLSAELHLLLESGIKTSSEKVKVILKKLLEVREARWSELQEEEKWDYTAKSLPDDIAGRYKNETSVILTEKCDGDILEAMCGFNSYIFPHIDKNVTAQDYSIGMLKKYEYPKRRRLQFNLNSLPVKKFEIPNETFDTITFVKGYKYIKSPNKVFSEFKRLLKPAGKLIFVESLSAGYQDLIVRNLKIKKCKEELLKNHFEIDDIKKLFQFDDLILFESHKT